jgi:hypothetical protein
VIGAADNELKLAGPPASILHLEFQSGPDASLPCDLNVYNSVLEKRHDLPVRSVLVLLSRRAELTAITGEYLRTLPGDATPYRRFRYDVLRTWELDAGPLLAGGLGTLPLAPISAVTPAELPGVLDQMKKRLAAYPDRRRVGRLWTAVYVLLGLRYERAMVEQILQGVLGMKESTTYQAIVAEGEGVGARKELRKILLSLGEDRFGTPAPSWAVKSLDRINSLEDLEVLARRVLHAKSWTDLLGEHHKPTGRKRS